MDYIEKASLCLLHAVNGIGNKTLIKLKAHFGSFAQALTANYNDLQNILLSSNLTDDIIKSRYNIDKYMQSLANEGIDVVTIEEEVYPEMLKNIYNPPYILYAKGDISLLKKDIIAIVGSRAATMYGKKVAFELGQGLATNNIVTISGMARGIDTEAHKGALAADGQTIAVLGSGINVIYPKENTNLYKDIVEKGVVISEFPPFVPPEPGNFPRRNRIISGLSYGVVVVEAKIKSGALITVDFALEQGRDVFAIPGPITSKNSAGTNNLIKQGAKLVSSIEDILEEYYDITGVKPTKLVQVELPLLDENEEILLKTLDFEPLHFDTILNETSLSVGDLSTILLNLEFKGIVKSMPGNYYVKVSDFSD